jgi:hypothetical protein
MVVRVSDGMFCGQARCIPPSDPRSPIGAEYRFSPFIAPNPMPFLHSERSTVHSEVKGAGC